MTNKFTIYSQSLFLFIVFSVVVFGGDRHAAYLIQLQVPTCVALAERCHRVIREEPAMKPE